MPGRRWTREGATAQQRADRLRAKAERLTRQADSWMTGAEREAVVGKRLAELPSEYTVVSNIPMPHGGAADHLVVGAGGMYLVDAKKYTGKLMYSKKMLWHGRFPITEKLETVQWEAEQIGDALGRSVVPVLCFVDAVLPQPVTTLGSVIVCRASALSTVVCSSHTTLLAAELRNLIAAARHLGAVGVSAVLDEQLAAEATVADAVTDAYMNDDATDPAGALARLVQTTGAVTSVDTTPDLTDVTDGPAREPRPPRIRRSTVFAVSALVVLGLTIASVLTISRWLDTRDTDEADAAATTAPSVVSTTTTTPATTTTTVPDESAVELQFVPNCDIGAQRWSLAAVWPGPVGALAYYEFAAQDAADGSWDDFGRMTAPESPAAVLTGLVPGEVRIVRMITATYDNIDHEPNYAVVTAPTDPC